MEQQVTKAGEQPINEGEQPINARNLIELLKEINIVIPVIQRDYAQGRENARTTKDIRKPLIEKMISCLRDPGKEKIDFNFVYGTKKDNTFYPVDGQQRLTSLYLLHWYLAVRGGIEEFFELSGRFEYRTRNSAQEFFAVIREAFQNGIDEENKIYQIVQDPAGDLKKKVEESAWFRSEWSNDPTVKGALVFLRDLADRNIQPDECRGMYDRLKGDAISFTVIMEADKENAESNAARSYSRMNARGRMLDSVENVKAMFDSMEKQTKTCFVESYDKEYLDKCYEKFTSSGDSLSQKTQTLNEKSMAVFVNIYRLWCELNKREKITAADFASEVYSASRLLNEAGDEKEIKFWKGYFEMLQSAFGFYIEPKMVGEETLYWIFDNDQDFDAAQKAKLLYIYYFHKKHPGTCATPAKVEQHLYILRCLEYQRWQPDWIESVRKYTEAVSASDDVFTYFENMQFGDLADSFGDINNGHKDMKVRLREQKIKIGIIRAQGQKERFFERLERGMVPGDEMGKIQILLHLAGYWGDPTDDHLPATGDYDKLCEYKRLAEEWWLPDDIGEWLKLYAVSANCRLDGAGPVLKTADEINADCGNNQHIFDDEICFWDDSVSKVPEQEIAILRRVFEHAGTIESLRKAIEADTDGSYAGCWLKYAVKYLDDCKALADEDENARWGSCLLAASLTNRKGRVYLQQDSNKEILFEKLVLIIKRLKEKKWTSANKVYLGRDHTRTLTYENGIKYAKSGSENAKSIAYNMKLIWYVLVTGICDDETQYPKEQCAYWHDEDQHRYYLYKLSDDKPYCFKEYVFDTTDCEQRLDKRLEEMTYFMDKVVTKQDGLDLHDAKGTLAQMGWEKEAGSRTRWCCKEQLPYNGTAVPGTEVQL